MMQSYEQPAITDLGSVLELTQGLTTGTRLDADFTAGTHVDDLTFS